MVTLDNDTDRIGNLEEEGCLPNGPYEGPGAKTGEDGKCPTFGRATWPQAVLDLEYENRPSVQ